MRVAIVGSVTIDHQVRAGAEPVSQLGGTALYGAVALHAEGCEVVCYSNLGDADRSEARRRFDRMGIDLRVGVSAATTTFRNHLRFDGSRRQELAAVADPIRLEHCASAFHAADLIHLGPLHGEDIDPAVFDALRDRGAAVSLDAQGLLRSSDLGAVRVTVSPAVLPALDAAQVVKLAAHEAESLERASGLALEEIAERHAVREIVVTQGAAGGFVIAARVRRPYAALPIDHITDTTGAGDVFFATYVAARLGKGVSIEASASHAAERAARHVAGELLNASAIAL